MDDQREVASSTAVQADATQPAQLGVGGKSLFRLINRRSREVLTIGVEKRVKRLNVRHRVIRAKTSTLVRS